ncbi:MFS transporter [Streptomyces cyaneochromogenes]|uniref:MFS transporter n=1 Tax=Streptomyces cyaneochromogenes TaxID=2496836 RepID=A0A3S9LZL3_9ACTN|nr:MFS transporter [Streptomyces cyaneochromogenes]AZQ32384.1 MFS transporter [Streptomyces cyaneochromogenes]
MASSVRATSATGLRGSTVFLAFGAFGLLWGLYAAALPEIKANTGATDGELGTALACVGLAAAPAMFLVGRLLDRYGRPLAIGALFLFAAVAPLPTLADSTTTLVVTLLLFGFGSGACDVVINSLAATVEAETGGRVLNRAHALFSVGLLLGSVATSATRGSGVSTAWPLGGLAVLTVIGGWVLRGRLPERLSRAQQSDKSPRGRRIDPYVLAFGALAALAALVESGVQQWSAVFLEDGVGASPQLSGLAPGVFAGSMALGRLGGHWLSTRCSDRIVLLSSGLVSGLGVLVVSRSQEPLAALAGFAVAGAAISVAAPTVYSVAGRAAPAERRGAVIGLTASIGYVGLLLGPVVVGQVAEFTQLRTAIGSLVVVSLALSIAALLLRAAGRSQSPGS